MKLITRPELHVDTQCTSSVLRSHSDYKSTIAGPSTLCIDAGFEQLNEAASSDENDEMDPDEEIMRLMSTIDSKGNYKPFKSNVAAMAYLLAHSPRPMLCSHMAATSNMFCRICNEFKALAQMALFVLSPFLAPAEIEVWLALSKNFVTAVVHGIFLLYGGSPKSTCFFIFLNICKCLVRHLVITPKGSSYSPSERCGDDLIALYRSMGVQRYLGGTSVQHDKPIHQPGTL
eukprot:Em0003g1049a